MDLLPCPFCGSRDIVSDGVSNPLDDEADSAWVICEGCGASSYEYFDTKEDAESAWNRRASGWIPVGERLPDDGMHVLVLADDAGECWFLIAVYDERMGHFETSSGRRMKIAPVTHWQPLPEPPV